VKGYNPPKQTPGVDKLYDPAYKRGDYVVSGNGAGAGWCKVEFRR
jgi:hypothetical protein